MTWKEGLQSFSFFRNEVGGRILEKGKALVGRVEPVSIYVVWRLQKLLIWAMWLTRGYFSYPWECHASLSGDLWAMLGLLGREGVQYLVINTDVCCWGYLSKWRLLLPLTSVDYSLGLNDLIVSSLELTVHVGDSALMGCVFQSTEVKRVTKVDWTFSSGEHAKVKRKKLYCVVQALGQWCQDSVGERENQVFRCQGVMLQELRFWSLSELGLFSAWTLGYVIS